MDNSLKQRNNIYIGVDIEKSGPKIISNPVISVGFAVCDSNFNLLEKCRFNLNVIWKLKTDGGDFEAKCWTEFWSTLSPELITKCKDNVMEQKTGWIKIAQWIDNLEIKWPSDEYKIIFITDNGSFDIGNIDYYFELYANRAPMRFSAINEYREIKAADDMFDMLPEHIRQTSLAIIKQTTEHDHSPENDAHFICLQYYHALLNRAV